MAPRPLMAKGQVALGLAANWRQFALLLAVNAFVGGMVGLERSVLPLLAQEEFGVRSTTAIVAFLVTFGLAKAIANLFAGHLSNRFTRRSVLIAGWLCGVPVPFVVIWAPTWGWIVAANLLLGLNQGLAWSMTVNMKLDLAGPAKRGLAVGLNEAAGYLSVAAAAFASGAIANQYGLRPEPFYLGIAFVALGLALSVLFVRDTSEFVRLQARGPRADEASSLAHTFAETSWRRRELFGISQAGFVNNLNDALAWGIFPLLFVSRGLSLDRVAVLSAVYPLAWGFLQMGTGWASDLAGRKPLVVGGMTLQAGGIVMVGIVHDYAGWLAAASALGAGTAMVYPALIAAIGDEVHPERRADAVGVYRFWRDSGAVAGALAAGAIADVFTLEGAVYAVAGVTLMSGVLAAGTMSEGQRGGREERRQIPARL